MTTKHIQLAGTATVGPKGQVVIPAEIREKMHIKPGSRLIVLYVADKQSVAFVTETQAQVIVDKLGSHVAEIQKIMTEQKAGE
jgi:AbrB family looped-hinge helix DNA binding protein